MNVERLFRIGLPLAASLLVAQAASADVFAEGDFLLRDGLQPASYEFTARLPAQPSPERRIRWPAGCDQTSFEQRQHGNRVTYRYSFRCTPRLADTAIIDTDWRIDGGRLTVDLAGGPAITRAVAGLKTVESAGLQLPVMREETPVARPWDEIVPDLLRQGVAHILFGWDHLAFVLCLCLMTSGWALLWLVTAFTLGHSVALSAAATDLVRLSLPPTEALIALSILFVAREGLLTSNARRDESRWQSTAVVVTFGLVHGLGFAGALAQIGMHPQERLPSLVAFNLGVEAGQLLFIALVLTVMACLRRVSLDTLARPAALYVAGMTAGYWLIERLVAMA